MRTEELLDLSRSLAGGYLARFEYPWQALEGLETLIRALGEELPAEEYDQVMPQVWVHRTARVAPTAFLGGPCIIGARSEIRHCAFLRENLLVGEDCIVGNSVELKNAILFDRVEVPHFNYVGDSILGCHCHMGAGAVTSNFKSDGSLISIRNGEERIPTGYQKFGAILGDGADVGCNSVLNPGTIVGRNTTIYPLCNVRGVVAQGCIYKNGGVIVPREVREGVQLP